ncbi:MAG TPA: hypothetical protein VNB23_04300, partial [Ramlibacter sp.]|nr:hypothetical protein [Ramlibacter sp.]
QVMPPTPRSRSSVEGEEVEVSMRASSTFPPWQGQGWCRINRNAHRVTPAGFDLTMVARFNLEA